MKTIIIKSGFTLIELMVVVIIVGILAAVAVPMMSSMRNRAIGTEALAALSAVESACANYYVAHGKKADDFSDLSDAGMISISDLSGTYFDHSDITGILNGFNFGTRGLTVGEGSAKGITVKKAANGTYALTGTYAP